MATFNRDYAVISTNKQRAGLPLAECAIFESHSKKRCEEFAIIQRDGASIDCEVLASDRKRCPDIWGAEYDEVFADLGVRR